MHLRLLTNKLTNRLTITYMQASPIENVRAINPFSYKGYLFGIIPNVVVL